MSAFEYLTVNTLTSYPFKDGRAVFDPLPLNPDVFIDLLFVATDRGIRRPYISRLQSTNSELNIFFKDAADGSEIFTVAVPSGEVINHFDNLAQSFYGFSHPKGHVKFVFGPGMPIFFALKQDAPYDPEHTELSPGAVIYSVPKVVSLDYESYIYTYGSTQDIVSVKTYYSGETAEVEAGTNTEFYHESPSIKYIDVGRGLGKGLHDPCNAGDIEDVLTINKIGPDANGNVFIKATECYTSKLLTENDRIFLRAALPDYTAFSIPHQNPNVFDVLSPGNTHHGLVFENFCSPKCPPENLNSFAEYLNRVTDGAADVFKIVHSGKETRGTCTFTDYKLVALDFCIASSVFDSDVPCSAGFIKYFHEGRKVKVYYGQGVYHTYTIKEVINSNEVLLFEEPYPLSGSTLSALEFKVLDLGFIDNLNYSVALHNLKTSKYDDPYIESNYTTVDAYYINKRYGTFITSTTVVYNPGRDPLDFLAIFDVPVGNPAEIIPGSIKVKNSNGDISYGVSAGTVDCKDYAIIEAIFFIPCGGNRGVVNVSIRHAAGTGADFLNSPFTLAAVSVACVQTALPAKTVTALEGTGFTYNFGITGATSYALSGDKPAWLSEDMTADAGTHLFGTPSGSTNASYPLTLLAQTAEGTFSQRITLKYVAKPVMDSSLAGKNIDIYLPDITSRTYVTSSPLWLLAASNSPTSYNSSGLPLGLSLNKNKIIGKFNLDSSVTYPKVYDVSFWASNAAGAGESINMTLTLNTGLTLPEAISGQSYCYNFPAESDRSGETIISDAPGWLTFKSSDILNSGECGFSGTPTGTISKQDTLLARFLYAGTYKSVYLTLPFSAKSYISYPQNNSVIDIYPPDYALDGTGREWTEASPLLTLEASNNPTGYVITGLPAGLSLTNAKIVGKITAAPGTYTVVLKAINSAGDGENITFSLRLNAQVVTTSQVLESAAFCYKILNLGGVQTMQLVTGQALPSWLVFSGTLTSTCNLSGSGAGAVSGDVEILVRAGLKGGDTVRKIVVPYKAKPRILSPALAQRVELVDENFASLTFDNSFPFLSVQATNIPTSYSAVGLPTGLSIDAITGKLIGTVTSGEWNAAITASNAAGSTTVNFVIFITATPNIFYVYEGQDYCYKVPTDSDGTSHYSLSGDLPSWLSFDPSIDALCNLSASSPMQTYSEVYDGLTLRKHRQGSTTTINQEFTISYVAKPRITFPPQGAVFEISPPDYKDTVFTSSNPLFTVATTNNATSFTATGFPVNTLRIDSLGRIIGVSGNNAITVPVKITLTASNSAGVSAPVEIYLKVRNSSNEVTVTRANALCYALSRTDSPQSFTLTTPADVDWISLNSGTGECDLQGAIPLSTTATRTFEITVTRNYNGGSTRENIKVHVVLPPVITSVNSGADLNTRNEYFIAPPDYSTRTYITSAPLLTIQASNNPTNFVATGLPAGLSIDSLGRVIGGPVTVAPGVYPVSVQASNAGGEGAVAIFNIRVSADPLEVETYTGADGCFKINTKDNATRYTLNGTLPNNLIFEGTPGINCNIRGSVAPGTADTFKVYQLTSTYDGGSSRIYLNLTNRSIPVITSPAQGQTVKIAPVDYFDIAFTEASPLLSVQATNKPTSFTATGLPAGLQITASGKIVGRTTAEQKNYTVSLRAQNLAGMSVITSFILDLNKIVPVVTWPSPTTIPFYQPLTVNELNATITPDIDGVYTYTPGLGANLGSTGTKTLKVVFSPTDTLNYAQATGETSIVANAGAPVITSVYTGTEQAFRSTYTIAPPDFSSRVYTISSPLLTIQASNNPTNFVATGLPAGLSIDSLGRVIGGPVTAVGMYEITVRGVNSLGEGTPAIFKIEVTNEIPSINTYSDENLCLELNTLDGATRYELQQGSALFAGLSFNTSPSAVCNVFGAPAVSVTTQEATLNIRSVYPGGHSSRYFKLNHLALPVVISPTEGQIIKKFPANFIGVTFTETNPLFTIVSSNSPEGYIFYNFPQNLYIDSAGRVLGTLSVQDIGTRNVSISPLNASGEGAQVEFILDLTSTPVELAWPTPEAIVFGTALTSTQLNATALGGVQGTMAYTFGGASVGVGTVLSAGSRVLKATFTPTDTTRYSAASREITLVVNKATPTIVWNNPGDIVYGTALTSTQLNATSAVQGTFSYSQPTGTILNAGTHTITVTFNPTDTNNYNSSSKTVSIVVGKATPTIIWPNPADIVYGTALSTSVQLNAVAKSGASAQSRIIAGTYTYSHAGTNAINKILNVGTHTLNVSFIVSASESANFVATPVTASTQLVVSAAQIPVTWNPSGSMVYGTPLNSTYLNAQASVSGVTLVYTPAAGEILPAGAATLTLTLTTADTNYATTSVNRTITVTKAPRDFNITSQATGKVGTSFTLNSNYTGEAAAVTYTSSNATVLSISGSTATILKAAQSAVVTAQVAASANYQSATATQTFTGEKGTSTLTITGGSTVAVGGTLNLSSSTTGSTGQITYTSLNTARGVINNNSSYVALTAGTGSIQAVLATDSNYEAATTTKSITVTKGSSSILSGLAPTAEVNTTAPLALTITGSSGVWSVVANPASRVSINTANRTLTFLSAGNVTLSFYLAEDTNYLEASSTKTISVS